MTTLRAAERAFASFGSSLRPAFLVAVSDPLFLAHERIREPPDGCRPAPRAWRSPRPSRRPPPRIQRSRRKSTAMPARISAISSQTQVRGRGMQQRRFRRIVDVVVALAAGREQGAATSERERAIRSSSSRDGHRPTPHHFDFAHSRPARRSSESINAVRIGQAGFEHGEMVRAGQVLIVAHRRRGRSKALR